MKLKEYITELSKIFDEPDVTEATFNIGIELIEHDVHVNVHSPNRVTFTVKRGQLK